MAAPQGLLSLGILTASLIICVLDPLYKGIHLLLIRVERREKSKEGKDTHHYPVCRRTVSHLNRQERHDITKVLSLGKKRVGQQQRNLPAIKPKRQAREEVFHAQKLTRE